MNFKKGDKVRLLNEKGHGEVVAIIPPSTIRVRTSEGMEFDFSAKQLVHADSSKFQKTEAPEKIFSKQLPDKKEEEEEELEMDHLSDGIYLLFTPQDEQRLLECDISIALVNNTDYDVLYCFSYKYEKEFVAMCTGTAEEGSVTALDTILRGKMEEYAIVKLDIIFFKNMPYEPLEPVSEIVKLKTVKFYKPNTYSENPFNGRLSLMEEVCLFPEEEHKPEPGFELQKKVAEFMSRKKEDQKNISRPHSYYAKQLEKEIDLHLEELTDNTSGMSNADKLNFQLSYFKRELETAIAGHTKKIVFIHGVGNGRLKTEIWNILNGYQNLRFHDASFRKYGYGATEVLIRG